MTIIEIAGKRSVPVIVERVEKADFRNITKSRFSFRWEELTKVAELYKLVFADKPIIIGLMALIDFPSECRIEIKLLASSVENVGKGKQYEGIAGCLIAYAAKKSIENYSSLASISLMPKTEIRQHYIKKYNMKPAGQHVFLEGGALLNLVNIYDI